MSRVFHLAALCLSLSSHGLIRPHAQPDALYTRSNDQDGNSRYGALHQDSSGFSSQRVKLRTSVAIYLLTAVTISLHSRTSIDISIDNYCGYLLCFDFSSHIGFELGAPPPVQIR